MKLNKSILPVCTGVFLSMAIISMPGCRKFVDLGAPTDRISSKVLFGDSSNSTAAVLGMYIDAITDKYLPDLFNGGLTFYGGLYSDELYLGNTNDQTWLQFYKNHLDQKNSSVWTMWRSAYLMLYKANACVEGIEGSTTLPGSVKQRLIGEAKFVRAFMYYNLVKVYGDVPLVLGTDFATNASMPRTPAAKVMEQVMADLNDAKSLLPETYLTTGRARPNKYTAIALLARIRLETGYWEDAEKEADLLLNQTAIYSLENSLDNVFSASSREAIWQLLPPDGAQTPEASKIIPRDATTIPQFNITNKLWNDFEVNDLRKQKWTASTTIGSITYHYPFKYKVRRGTPGQAAEPYTIFRMSETLLIRAEARARQGDVEGARADLDQIRQRAGLDPATANDQSSMIAAILAERRFELFCESGHRWTDLKRSGQVDALMSVIAAEKGGTWKPEWVLFPLPFEQLEINPFLTQNKGY